VKAGHLHPDLGDHHFSQTMVDPWDRVQPGQLLLKRVYPLLDLADDPLDGLYQGIQAVQDVG
jgi:hypothetical protein